MAALEGLRVVEFGRMVAAPYCARLLAGQGAYCLKVERSEGDPLRRWGPFGEGWPAGAPGALYLYLNGDKPHLRLDAEPDAARARLLPLLAESDLFVSDLQPAEAARLGLSPHELRAVYPRLIVVSVTPFGMSGPRADQPGGELVQWAAGGYAMLTPAGGRREGGRPLKPAGHQAGFMAGAAAAAGAMAALHRRALTGRGQHVDVSVQEVLICANDSTFARYLTDGDNIPTRLVQSSFEFLPCKDGYVSLLFVREDQWQRMVELMGNPDWATELFASFASRRAHWDALAALLSEWFMQYTAEELYRLCQARRIPLAPVMSARDVLASPHLAARGYFSDLPLPNGRTVRAPGAPLRMTDRESADRRARSPAHHAAAPAPGYTSSIDERGGSLQAAARTPAAVSQSAIPDPQRLALSPPFALATVRVLDFTWVWAGPQSCRFLADLGAEVIKIESERRVDNYRTAAAPDGTPYGYNRSPGFNTLNRNKLSVRLDLRTPAGRDLALRLAAVSDLVVENFAPRVMPSFGLGYEDFASVNPVIVMLSMSGFGGTGPDRDNVLYGNSQVALAGLGHASGFPGGPPENIGVAHGDPVAAYHAAFAAMAAVHQARRTGQGQHIDLSQWEAMTATVPEPLLEYQLTGREPPRRGNRDPLSAPHGYYRCRKDAVERETDPQSSEGWIAIAVETDAQWRALCEVMGDPAWSVAPALATAEGRLAHAQDLDARVEAWTVTQERDGLARRLAAAGVPAYIVAGIDDLVADPHLMARGFWEEIAHPEAGRHRYVGVPFRLSESPARLYRHAPLFGGDHAYVLGDLLGVAGDELERLAIAGALT